MLLTLLLLTLCEYSRGEIIQQPESITTTLGLDAIFVCKLEDEDEIDSLIWVINAKNAKNVEVDDYTDENVLDRLRQRGIYYSILGSQSVLRVHSTILNNGSTFRCKEELSEHPFTIFSQSAHLTILGPPLPPAVVSDVKEAEITWMWEAPFTWENHTILQYVVSITDASGFNRLSVPAQLPNTSYSYDISAEVRRSCLPIEFEVLAVSDLGWSENTVSKIYLPKVPDSFGNVTVSIDETLQQLVVNVQPPELCSYQLGNLSLIFWNTVNATIAHIYKTYMGNQKMVTFYVDKDVFLKVNRLEQQYWQILLRNLETDVNTTGVIDGALLDVLLQSRVIASTKAAISVKDGIIIGLCCLTGVLFFLLMISVILKVTRYFKSKDNGIEKFSYKDKDSIV